MCSAYQVKIMLLKELVDDVRTESKGDPTIIFSPAIDVLVGIRPQ